MRESAKVLAHHYHALGDLKLDFRNYNLNRLILSKITGSRVVDIGCGTGFLLSELAKQGKEVTGIEPNEAERALAKEYHPDLKILGDLAENIDTLLDTKADSIVMIDVLEHIEDDKSQVKKIYEKLESRGEFIVVVPAHQFLYGTRDKSMGHYRRYQKKAFRRLLEHAGFKISSIRYWNALGVIPYFFSEKMLKRPLNSSLRTEKGGFLSRIMRGMLNLWFKYVENNINFGFGLSIICVAKKP